MPHRGPAGRRMPSTFVLALVPLVLASLAAGGCHREPAATASAWAWHPGGLGEALAAARVEGRLALVEVGAAWCPSCHALERDVFERNGGRLPLDSLVPARVDFDAPEGQSVVRRYRILGLPTTLILQADGTERGRIEGFDGVDAFVAAVQRAVRGDAPPPKPADRVAAAPDDASVAAAAGADYLARGDEAEGIRQLQRARALDPDDRAGAWREATRVLGRWHSRAKGDPEAALPYFLEAAGKAADERARWGFAYWAAMTWHAAGKDDEATRYLDSLEAAHPGQSEPLAVRAEYLWMTGGDAEKGLALAREAARKVPEDDYHHWLVAVLALRTGDRAAARQSIQRALSIAPSEALYEDFRDRLADAR